MGWVCGSTDQANQGRGFLYQQRGTGFLYYGKLLEREEEEGAYWIGERAGPWRPGRGDTPRLCYSVIRDASAERARNRLLVDNSRRSKSTSRSRTPPTKLVPVLSAKVRSMPR